MARILNLLIWLIDFLKPKLLNYGEKSVGLAVISVSDLSKSCFYQQKLIEL